LKFAFWLMEEAPRVYQEAQRAVGSPNVDKIVRWLVQSKYQLGVNPEYNRIFNKYMELNAARLQEIHELESAAPAGPPSGAAAWPIDPEFNPVHEGSQVAKLLEGAEKAQSPQKTIVVSAPDARGTRYLSARSTNGVLRSIGDLLSGPDGTRVLQD